MQNQVGSWVKMSNYAFKLWVQSQSFPKVLMGFDIGLKSTGIAITSSDLRHAFVLLTLIQYLTTLTGNLLTKNTLQRATRLIIKQKPIGLVIGKPSYVTQSKSSENIIEAIDKWVEDMSVQHTKTSKMRFTFVDEAYTTLNAVDQIKLIEREIKYWGHLRKEKELVDGMAAINILRKYLQFQNKKG